MLNVELTGHLSMSRPLIPHVDTHSILCLPILRAKAGDKEEIKVLETIFGLPVSVVMPMHRQ